MKKFCIEIGGEGVCDHEEKAQGKNPLQVPASLFLKFFVSILLNKNKSEKDREEKKEKKNHRRDGLPAEGYEGAEQGHIFP